MANTPQLTIANIMLGRGLGGIEQSSLDYTLALQEHGHDVHYITDAKADINTMVCAANHVHHQLRQHGKWDIIAARKLHSLLRKINADIIITHGNRALCLASAVRRAHIVLIAVSHNYKMQHLHKADHIFCITKHMRESVINAIPSLDLEHCHHVPNMITARPLQTPTPWHLPPHIGAMGRLVKKKGFDVWLRALALLKERNVAFVATLAGDGEEKSALLSLRNALGLKEHVHFAGWVANDNFYNDIDIFCLPSHHEPFGIVALEAMNASVPIISTASEGPKEIFADHDIGLLVECNNINALADAIAQTICDYDTASKRALRAHAHINQHYNHMHIGGIINNICTTLAVRAQAS